MSYEMISSTYDMALRTGPTTSYPRITNLNNPKIVNGYILRNNKMFGDVLNVTANEQWLHVTSVNNMACDGWVAYKIGATVYCVLTEIVPPSEDLSIVSVTLTPTYSDGTIGSAVKYVPEV